MSNLPQTQLSILPAPAEYAMYKEIAQFAVRSGLLPQAINTPEKAMIIALKARELNIPPMLAFSHFNVINGKPTMSAELMLTQIYKMIPGAVINFVTTTAETCVIECRRPNSNFSRWEFSMLDAEKAGIAGKGPWKSYPAAMLRARCISSMARAVFSDALNGVSYTPEEMGAEIELDGDGNEIIKDVTPEEKPIEKLTPQELNVRAMESKKAATKATEAPPPPPIEEPPIFDDSEPMPDTSLDAVKETKKQPKRELGEQKFKVGQYAGHMIHEYSDKDLIKYIEKINTHFKNNPDKLMPDDVAETIWIVKEYLGIE